MAKFNFYEIKSMKFPAIDKNGNLIENAEPVVIDHVILQITKRVNSSTMGGEKGEEYTVPISDIPSVFLSDVKFPAMVGDDSTARVEAVKKFLDKHIGKKCWPEDIAKKNKRILTYIEFEN